MILDKNGVFKYIQIAVHSASVDFVIVRGFADCAYHADILAKFKETELQHADPNAVADCPGGGRVDVSEANKTLFIYGYSQGFGRANHALT